MPYLVIGDFKSGMDRRRPRHTGVPGSLWNGENVVITRGGDIAKAKKFSAVYTLDTGTFGLARVNSQLQVYGSGSVTPPTGVSYQQLAAPSTPNMERILDVKTPDGKAYVIAKYDNGQVYHFYDGSRVTDWDSLADGNASFSSVTSFLAEEISGNSAVRCIAVGAELLLRATVPGTAFTISASATNGGSTNDQTATVTTPVANVAGVANVDATGTVTVTAGTFTSGGTNKFNQISVASTNLLATAVAVGASNSATATALAQAINNNSGVSGYTATAVGNVVTIIAPALTGATENSKAVSVSTAGDAAATTANMSGGVTAVTAVAQQSKVVFGGTFEAADTFTVTVNGTAYKVTGRGSAMGTSALVYKNRIYVAAYNIVRYSQLNDYDDFTDANAASGAGFFAVAGAQGSSRIVALAPYQDRVAIFARDFVATYFLEADAQTNAFDQSIGETGTEAAGSVIAYGNRDLFYLDQIGVRSLQARDSSNTATVNDIGTLIDTYLADLRDTLQPTQIRNAKAVIEPRDGLYMLALGTQVIVLSRYPSSSITAWTVLKPGFSITDFAKIGSEVYARSGNTIYAYGGLDGDEYVDADDAIVETPFLDIKTPATYKFLTGFDMFAQGTWELRILTDPNDETVSALATRITGVSANLGAIAGGLKASVFAMKFTCTSNGYASLSQSITHHDLNEKRIG
jgi:hypothetical protein